MVATTVFAFYVSVEDLSVLDTEEGQQLINGARRIGALFLGLGVFALAGLRVAYHPAYNPLYRDWLRTTPWHNGVPLPGGSPFPGVAEVVLLAIGGGLVFWLLPILTAAWLLSAYGLSFACFVVLPYLSAKMKPGWHPFVVVLLVGVLVVFSQSPWIALGASLAIFWVALHALSKSLKSLPQHTQSWLKQEHQLPSVNLSGVEPEAIKPPFTFRKAAGLSILAGYGAGVLHHVSDLQLVMLVVPLCIVIGFAVLLRLAVYANGCNAPISLKQRFKQRRFIIPGYDVIFVAPLLTVLAGFAVLGFGYVLSVYPPVVTGLAFAIPCVILLKGGPAKQHWRLTADHRVVVGR